MKRSLKGTNSILPVLFSMVLALLLAGCGGGGGSAPPAAGIATTTVSGKVTLSSTVIGKPALYRKGGSANEMTRVLSAAGVRYVTGLSGATVELYDADHPEWLYPVATTTASTATGSEGSFKLSVLANAAKNTGATYTDGTAIPAGNYTLAAYNYDFNTSKVFVAVQAVVKKLAGDVTGDDLTAFDSATAAAPSVSSMFGLSKNTDGTYGGTTTTLSANVSIQVTFSMAMARLSMLDAISIKNAAGTAVAGSWKISADLLSAMFVPTSALAPSTTYTVTVGGGTAAKTAKNVFGKAIAATVKGTFSTLAANDANYTDVTKPNAQQESPVGQTGVAITTPIRIRANEPMDVTTISASSTPVSIGDKPSVIYIGKVGKTLGFEYIYEIVPATALAVSTTYAITVSGGKDLAGNVMTSFTMDFTTGANSAVTGTAGTATADAQTGVIAVLGKWAQAMTDQNISILTSYMAGDFYWINDPNNSGSDDLNRDGRQDLQEFTLMLDSWFAQLKSCGSTVTSSVDTANTSVLGGILITAATTTTPATAQIAFTLTVTSANTTNLKCAEGPNNTLYAELQNINGSWIMTRGSDMPLVAVTVGMTKLVTTAPADGAQLVEPTATMPAMPDFKWTADTWINSAGTAVPFASYAVVLIDNKGQWGETGWVGIVDGTTTTAKFTPASGLTGGLLVLPSGKDFGFRNSLAGIVAGGDYTWAVLGFKTQTQNDFKLGLADPLLDLGGSSPASKFTVAGVYKELKITVQDSLSNVYAVYNDWMGGYDVGNAGSVTLSITTPDANATIATVNVNGYTSQQLSVAFSGGVVTVTASLSNGINWVEVCDNYVAGTGGPGYCAGLSKQFNISTKDGALPKIKIISVSGKTCAPVATATLTGPDSWNNYSSADVCTVDISGTVDATITGTLKIQVGNNDDIGQYRGPAAITGAGTSTATFLATGIPVFKGENWVQVQDQNWVNSYQINVTTSAGSTYTPPIVGTLSSGATTLVPASSTLREVTYDVGGLDSVTANVTMAFNSTCTTGQPCSGWSQNDPAGAWIAGGPITASPFSGPIALYQGWNYFNLSDAAGNYLQVKIYTTGGTAFVPPNSITAVTDTGGTPLTQTQGTYDAAANCQVKITGTTMNPGSVSVNLYNYTTSASVSEYQSVTVTGTAAPYGYAITQNVYAGTNNISIFDSMWNWQGANVSSTCATQPVALTASSVSGATYSPAMYYWDAGTANTVTIGGTAATGKTVTASVSSGTSYNTVTATAAAGAYSLSNVPIYNGYNYISVTDGANWTYLTVYTTGGATYAAPFAITSVTPATDDLGTITSTDATGYSYSGSVSVVTISGTSTSANCTNCVTWYGGGMSGTASITGGVFSVNVSLLNGSNYVDLYGPNGNWDGVYIYTTGSIAPIQYVTMTNPLHNATVSGGVAVTATVDQTIMTNYFIPLATDVWGYVYDEVTYQTTMYSSDSLLNCTGCGYGVLPLTYTASTGAVSFTATVNAGNATNIQVFAYDSSSVGHGTGIYVNNNLGYTSFNYKPGSNKASSGNAKAKAHQAEFLKKTMRR